MGIRLLLAAAGVTALTAGAAAAQIRSQAPSPEASVAAGDITGDGIADIVVAAGAGGGPHVRVFNGADGAQLASIMAFSPSFTGGVRVAVGDVTGDGTDDIIVGAGPGAGPHVKVFEGASRIDPQGKLLVGTEAGTFQAFDEGFSGGVFVAAGDVTGDGRADIIVGAGPGAGPHVKVFDGASESAPQGKLFVATEAGTFHAYDPGFRGGVRVGVGDVTGDGLADIITAPGAGGGPHIKVFDGASGEEAMSFFAYNPSFTGGIFVAAGDVNNDGVDDIITGAGASAGPHVKVFNGATGAEIHQFAPYGGFQGGVRVAAGDINNDSFDDIIVAADAGAGAGPHVKVFDGATGEALNIKLISSADVKRPARRIRRERN